MSVSAVVSNDTVSINGRILRDWADGDIAKLDMPDALTNMTTGKDENTIYAYSYKGKNAKMELRLIQGSSDDQFLNGLLQTYNQNPSMFNLLTMEFDKNVGDGSGNLNTIIYLGNGGTFEKQPVMVENAQGETAQAVAIWQLMFANVDRSIV